MKEHMNKSNSWYVGESAEMETEERMNMKIIILNLRSGKSSYISLFKKNINHSLI